MDREDEIAQFLVKNVEPWKEPSRGTCYRASAYLRDGTYLPCVVFANETRLIDLAIKRFSETNRDEYQHRLVVGAFVARPGRVPIYDVARVESSPYAWPQMLLRKIHGETTMGWTSFTAKMNDGKLFAFGTPFNFEFFDMPEGYSYNDITEIHSGMVVNDAGLEEPYSHDWARKCFRDKPFFSCYTDRLSIT